MASVDDRIIVLIDMDCFFCQVETKLQPDYKGKPLAVVQYNQWRLGGIIAVNYEAREYGVTRHMRGDEAKEKCPDIVLAIVPCLRGKADTSRYRTAGRSVIEVLKSHCNKIERASVDEAYLDITQLVDERISSATMHIKDFDKKLHNTYIVGYSEVGVNDEEQRTNGVNEWLQNTSETNDIQAERLRYAGIIVEEIRADIYAKTEFQCSAGISYNKILAKLACGLHKPNRQTILPMAAVPSLFSTLPVKKVRNLGGKFGDIVIESLKCNVMADLLQYSLEYLQNRFDEKTGLWLYNIARGIDNEPVVTRLVSKSIGACKKFPGKQALSTTEMINHWIGELTAEICERLEQDNEENERRATLLTISYHYQQSNSIVSQSKSLPINSYKHDKLQNQCFKVITKIQHPIVFLGLSAGKFVKAKGSENFVNFFKCEKNYENTNNSITEKTEVNGIQQNTIEEISNVKKNISVTDDLNESARKKNSPKTTKVKSFFKFVNNIPSPKSENSIEKIKKALDESENVKKSFFANILKVNDKECNSEVLNKHDNEASCSSTIENESLNQNKQENLMVTLQDIFPDLNNIDQNVLSCLPVQLRKEAALLKKNNLDKISSKVGKLKSSKTKSQKQIKNGEKSIHSFFIKTGNNSEMESNFHKCEQCSQLIQKEKVDQHNDYHIAQSIQKVINKTDEIKSKRKNSCSENSPKKRPADDSQFKCSKVKTLTTFLCKM